MRRLRPPPQQERACFRADLPPRSGDVGAQDRWCNETPYGRGKDDPILVDPATGKAYRTLPKRLMERIQREVEQEWTYQVGRRIACSLAVIHAPRLTGHPWGQHDHEAHFGHSTATANGYYFDKKLPRNRRLEEGASEQPDHTASAGLSESEGLSVALAKQLLARLCELTSTSRNALATQLGISETAIRKWQANGKSVPGMVLDCDAAPLTVTKRRQRPELVTADASASDRFRGSTKSAIPWHTGAHATEQCSRLCRHCQHPPERQRLGAHEQLPRIRQRPARLREAQQQCFGEAKAMAAKPRGDLR